jgi:hypothetical protein
MIPCLNPETEAVTVPVKKMTEREKAASALEPAAAADVSSASKATKDTERRKKKKEKWVNQIAAPGMLTQANFLHLFNSTKGIDWVVKILFETSVTKPVSIYGINSIGHCLFYQIIHDDNAMKEFCRALENINPTRGLAGEISKRLCKPIHERGGLFSEQPSLVTCPDPTLLLQTLVSCDPECAQNITAEALCARIRTTTARLDYCSPLLLLSGDESGHSILHTLLKGNPELAQLLKGILPQGVFIEMINLLSMRKRLH